MNILNLFTITRYVKPKKVKKVRVPIKRKRKPTKKFALVMPYGKHQGKLLSDVPCSYARWLSENGQLDKPRYKWLKDGLKKHGKLNNIGA